MKKINYDKILAWLGILIITGIIWKNVIKSLV